MYIYKDETDVIQAMRGLCKRKIEDLTRDIDGNAHKRSQEVLNKIGQRAAYHTMLYQLDEKNIVIRSLLPVDK